jgi:hypothetical protein
MREIKFRLWNSHIKKFVELTHININTLSETKGYIL